MKNEWILDVLADLKNFAKANHLPELAEQLADTASLAAVELSSAEAKAKVSHGDEFSVGNYSAASGDGRRL